MCYIDIHMGSPSPSPSPAISAALPIAGSDGLRARTPTAPLCLCCSRATCSRAKPTLQLACSPAAQLVTLSKMEA